LIHRFYLQNSGLSYEQAFIKRFMDIVGSAALILLSSPIMLIVALMIKIQDYGPVIYKQERLTLNNKTFEIYKFRSMKVTLKRMELQDLL